MCIKVHELITQVGQSLIIDSRNKPVLPKKLRGTSLQSIGIHVFFLIQSKYFFISLKNKHTVIKTSLFFLYALNACRHIYILFYCCCCCCFYKYYLLFYTCIFNITLYLNIHRENGLSVLYFFSFYLLYWHQYIQKN